jgi:hypothetical protein
MHAPPINPKEAQEIARRSGNDRLMFWTSVASLGFMGIMAATTTAQMIFNMARRGYHGHVDELEPERGRGRGR